MLIILAYARHVEQNSFQEHACLRMLARPGSEINLAGQPAVKSCWLGFALLSIPMFWKVPPLPLEMRSVMHNVVAARMSWQYCQQKGGQCVPTYIVSPGHSRGYGPRRPVPILYLFQARTLQNGGAYETRAAEASLPSTVGMRVGVWLYS